MSGRRRVTLADGRRVTGYRKTLAQRAAHTPEHLRQAWQLSILLPADDMRFFGLHPDGSTDVMCVRTERIGSAYWVCAEGKNREFVLTQMVEWLRRRAPDYMPAINGTIYRPGDPDGPTLSGPRHGPETYPVQIRIGPKGQSQVHLTGGGKTLRV